MPCGPVIALDAAPGSRTLRRTRFPMSRIFRTAALCLAGIFSRLAAAATPDAIVAVIGDMHSAYDRTAQFVGHIDRLRAENPGVPFAVLIDGDTFELGNAVARRSRGAIEFAMLAALAQRAPTILNLGNHEPEFFDMAETVARVQAAGVTVIGGNALDRTTGRPYAPASARLELGARQAVVVGITTDRLDTFRVAIRPGLDLANPVVWSRDRLPALLAGAPLPVVLSHAGLRADREILPLVPDGTLYAGAHDHLRFVHRDGRTVYFHSGSWTECLSVARLYRAGDGFRWELEQVRIDPADPADSALSRFIVETLARHLTAEETAVVGHRARALDPGEAARFAVEAVRASAGVDAAAIGATTFGAGLPAGDVSRFALDACVRFDGTVFVGEIDGARLRRLLARANPGPDTPLAERDGENLVVVAPSSIEPGRRYRLATTDWAARHAVQYFGDAPPALVEKPELKVKAAVILALAPQK
jgi:2',3'-cyclic-nucleotide 2'-phosphodiesterase (5'-nucleotidase family)